MEIYENNQTLFQDSWDIWNTKIQVVVDKKQSLKCAQEILHEHLVILDSTCNKFRTDSEIYKINLSKNQENKLSPLLSYLVYLGIKAAQFTSGSVDLTFKDTKDNVQNNKNTEISNYTAAGWRRITLQENLLNMPQDLSLDLGNIAKAAAAEAAAKKIYSKLKCSTLIKLGEDIATAGPPPKDGWNIITQDTEERMFQIALKHNESIATSGTLNNSWQENSQNIYPVHDISAMKYWKTVSVIASNCFLANIVSIATMAKESLGQLFLKHIGLPARLIRYDGKVIYMNGWTET